jgi:hypothetical protein
MRKAGFFLIGLAAVIILWNAVIVKAFNRQESEEHPFVTLLSGGANLKRGYSFTPPFTGFEIMVLVCGIGGVVFVCVSSEKRKE